MSALVTVLLTLGSALIVQLVVQFLIVPRIEARKRREQRWETYVHELGELLTTALNERATEASIAQWVYQGVLQMEGSPDAKQDTVEQLKRDHSEKARRATLAFNDLAHSRVPWLVDRIKTADPRSEEIIGLVIAARHHRIRAMAVDDWSAAYVPPDMTFDEAWDQEGEARRALVKKVTVLLDMPRPPRVSMLRHCQRRVMITVRRAIAATVARTRRTAISRTG
jgi:hypothetical protein